MGCTSSAPANELRPEGHEETEQAPELSSAVDRRGLVRMDVSANMRSSSLQQAPRPPGSHNTHSGPPPGSPSTRRAGATDPFEHVKAEDTPVVFKQKIGQGGFGTIFLAELAGRPVAVKVIRIKEMYLDSGVLVHEEKKERLADMESFLNTNINHPNVVTTYRADLHLAEHHHHNHHPDDAQDEHNPDDIYLDMLAARPPPVERGGGGGRPSKAPLPKERIRLEWHIIMEFCPLGSLQDALDNQVFQRELSPTQMQLDLWAMLQTLIEIVEGLLYLHSLKIMHGDLKAANVLLQTCDADQRGFIVKITDFGLSRVLSGKQSHISTSTIGTVTHMPPELLASGLLTPKADVYAVGVLMWEMYTSERPFRMLSDGQVIVHVVTQQLRPVFPRSTPPGFSRLAQDCWAESKAVRPSMESVLERLTGLQTELCPQGAASPWTVVQAMVGERGRSGRRKANRPVQQAGARPALPPGAAAPSKHGA